MQESMVAVAAVGVVTGLPRILLFWLMSRERRRIVAAVSGTGAAASALVLDHRGPGRASLTLLPAPAHEGGER
ncbi:hypothetical protein QCN29_00365 [Streptomyces sp. HNM0663]|uniref:Uncharacterized protein n=1 Tax=Streptomyces chengmaiensis TaxID=3040919 RepID=A0ABT6HER8_9ACTN|nr:hypothetical protein [Streptomyces chengmaiensis]MDH2387262.1 hypothetical protein [Streptomyces chengmaiensis]